MGLLDGRKYFKKPNREKPQRNPFVFKDQNDSFLNLIGLSDWRKYFKKWNRKKHHRNPFICKDKNVLVYRWRSNMFWFSLGLLFLACLVVFLALYSGQTLVREPRRLFLVVAFLTLIGSMLFFKHVGWKCLEIYRHHEYKYYLFNDLVYTSHLANLYIKLIVNYTEGNEKFYGLVLSGFMIEEIQLVRKYTKNKMALEHLGRYIARQANINYFDCENVSRRHVIWHNN